MPYIEAITEAGSTIEIERYYSARYGKRGQGRADRVKATPEEQKRINTRQAEKKLRRLINANFSGNDFHVVLPYIHKRGEEPRSREDMRDDIARFLRTMRKAYKAAGQELKYIHVAEIGQKGARHHHIIINHIDTSEIVKAWPHARAQIFPLDSSGQYAKLASYLIKYTDKHVGDGTPEEIQSKRWACSRNLVRPETKKRIITGRAWYRELPAVPRKYAGKYEIDADSVAVGVQSGEYCGYGFMRFTLVRSDTAERGKHEHRGKGGADQSRRDKRPNTQ